MLFDTHSVERTTHPPRAPDEEPHRGRYPAPVPRGWPVPVPGPVGPTAAVEILQRGRDSWLGEAAGATQFRDRLRPVALAMPSVHRVRIRIRRLISDPGPETNRRSVRVGPYRTVVAGGVSTVPRRGRSTRTPPR